VQQVAAEPAGSKRASVGPRLAWLRARATTTPGRLRVAAVLLVVGAVVLGVVAGTAANTRSQAAHAARTQAEPLLVEAEGLYASLSDADATAATTFVTGGLEPVASRQRYVNDLKSASRQLASLGQQVGTSPQARSALMTVTTQLPVYAGLVEAARANNRQGFPVGAAYLRQASALMHGSGQPGARVIPGNPILPAASQLYEIEARRLNNDYRSGVSGGTLVAFVLAAVAMLALLVITQLYLARSTRRVFNVALAGATVVVVAAAAFVLVSFVTEQNALARAQRDGSDPVQVLGAARILMSNAQGDESLALAARGGGGGDQNLADFDAVATRLDGTGGCGGLLGEAATMAQRTGSRAGIVGLCSNLARYLGVHRQVAARENDGNYKAAANLAVGLTASEAPLYDALNSGLGQQIVASRQRFEGAADDATSALGGLWLAIPLLAVAVAVLALLGLRQRINEYR
jgi:hypothetical protein